MSFLRNLFSKDRTMSSDTPVTDTRDRDLAPGASRERPVVTEADLAAPPGAEVVDQGGGQDDLPAPAHYNPYMWPGSMESEADEGTQAHAGSPKDPEEPVAERLAVEDAMREVYDPEIPVNIYDLGLIYGLEIAGDGTVDVTMTLTAPACPVAGTLPGEVARAIATVPGTGEVTVTLTWDPPWDKEKMTEDARLALGIY
ncbi:MAG: DUF59 domain-containing protein [Tistlia sp.]|uniref:DUF59 domain-containing protein n=1 Tax=Tistlia sp. TaxID=3057121 RepID=UPI0034A0D356